MCEWLTPQAYGNVANVRTDPEGCSSLIIATVMLPYLHCSYLVSSMLGYEIIVMCGKQPAGDNLLRS